MDQDWFYPEWFKNTGRLDSDKSGLRLLRFARNDRELGFRSFVCFGGIVLFVGISGCDGLRCV